MSISFAGDTSYLLLDTSSQTCMIILSQVEHSPDTDQLKIDTICRNVFIYTYCV